MVTYSSEFVEQIVIERDLLNHKLKQQQSDLRKLIVRMREGRDYYEKDGSISTIPYLGKDCADMIEKLIEGE